MPKCTKCENSFPNRITIENKVHNINKRKYCLDCSPFGLHNTKQLHIIIPLNTIFCPKCKLYLPEIEFNWKIMNVKRQCNCKHCQCAYTKEHYKNNPQPYKNRARKRAKVGAARILEYLKTHPCIDCGETDPVVLEFDHLENKEFTLTSKRARSLKNESWLIEVAKCEIRCSNCHKKRHAKTNHSYKYESVS